jgi:hypothetical protein
MIYYDITDYVSNSDLSEFDKLLHNKADFGGDKEKIFAFGNLVDALISEPDLVDMENKTVTDAHGEILHFTEEEWQQAQRMKHSALKNPLVNLLVQSMEFQVVAMNPEFEINCEYAHFFIPARGKADGIAAAIETGMDLKTTACVTKESFSNSIDLFSYDRQAAWYMDLFKLDKFIFVGISKKMNKDRSHEIFIHAVERGDVMYSLGLKKYQKLAYQYKTMILDLWPAG